MPAVFDESCHRQESLCDATHPSISKIAIKKVTGRNSDWVRVFARHVEYTDVAFNMAKNGFHCYEYRIRCVEPLAYSTAKDGSCETIYIYSLCRRSKIKVFILENMSDVM